MSAREVIANCPPIVCGKSYFETSHDVADTIITALTAAGYRILAPGEPDPETVERCAAECDRIDNDCGMEAGLAAACATAIRSLSDKEPLG